MKMNQTQSIPLLPASKKNVHHGHDGMSIRTGKCKLYRNRSIWSRGSVTMKFFLRMLNLSVVLWAVLHAPEGCCIDIQDGATLPSPTFSTTRCRLLINEINLNTEDTRIQQFVELARYCPDTVVYERAISMKGVKLLFISHDGYLHAMCELNNRLVATEIIKEKYAVAGTPKTRKRRWLYVIGNGYENINFKMSECELPDIGLGLNVRRFPMGVDYPYAIAVVYSNYPENLKSLRLLDDNGVYRRVLIKPEMLQSIKKYLQDFYIYGSSTRFQHCSYFDSFYAYKPSKHLLLRDWTVLDQQDTSSSRCSSRSDKEILPMQPGLWQRTVPTPGEINKCRSGFRFHIEDYQSELEAPFEFKYGDGLKHKCVSFTKDDANVVGYITYPENYKALMKFADVEANEPTASMVQQVAPADGELENTGANSGIIVDINVDDSDDTEGNEFLSSPQSSKDFEDSLEGDKPYIWTDCARFSEEKRMEIERIPTKPVVLTEVTKPNTCNWFEYLSDTKLFRCRLCHTLLKQGVIFDTPKSKFVTDIMKQGVMNWDLKNRKNVNTNFMRKHEKSIFHLMTVNWFSLFDRGLRGEELSEEFYYKDGPFMKYIKSTVQFMVVVKQSIRLGLPFRKFQILTELLTYFDVNIGYLFQNFRGMKVAVTVISDMMHQQFCKELVENKSPVSILIDSTTDIQTLPVTAVLFQTYSIEKGQQIRLYRILKLEKGETGKQLYDAFMKAVKADGIEEYILKSLHGVTSDGAPNVFKTFNDLINKVTEQNILRIWCRAHLADLSYKGVIKKQGNNNLLRVGKVINSCSLFFKKSAKRKQVLNEVASQNGIPPFVIKRTHAIRWISGNIRAFHIILEKWMFIVEALRRILASPARAFDAKVKQKAAKIQSDLKDPVFLTSLAFLCDVGDIMKYVDLEYQKRGTTLISKKSMRQEFKSKIESLKGTDLVSVTQQLLPNAKYLRTSDLEKVNVMTLEEFETQHVEFHGVWLSEPSVTTVGKRLHEKQDAYLNDMIVLVNKYFKEDVLDLYEVFNPMNFPVSRLADRPRDRLHSYGTAELTRMNNELKWGYEPNELIKAWKELFYGLIADKDFNTYKIKQPEEFWGYYLPKGSSVGFNDIMIGVMSRAMSISSSNAETERALSLYNGVKTFQRFLLRPSTVESILRIRINSNNIMNTREGIRYAKAFVQKGYSRTDATKRKSKTTVDIQEWDNFVVYEGTETGDEDDIEVQNGDDDEEDADDSSDSE